MNSPCQSDGFPVAHVAMDCIIYKRLLADKEKASKTATLNRDKWRTENDRDAERFMVIFGQPEAHPDRQCQNLADRG